jgi:hypothetical protein
MSQLRSGSSGIEPGPPRLRRVSRLGVYGSEVGRLATKVQVSRVC